MDKQQKQLIATGGLVVVLIFSVVASLKKKPAKKTVDIPASGSAASVQTTAPQAAASAKPTDELSLQ
jgi:hypothetical protein